MQKRKLDRKLIICIAFYSMLLLEIAPIIPKQIKGFIEANREIKELRKKILQFDQDIKLEGVLSADRDNIAKAVSDIETKIVPVGESALISGFISTSARDANIDVQEIITSAPKVLDNTAQGKFLQLPIKLEARASYHDLGRFLSLVENGPYCLQAQELSIKESTPYHIVKISLVALMKE